MNGSPSLFADADDEGRLRKAGRRPEIDLDITPMIDVTFLLLIFFMVTSTMQALPESDIPPAKHGVGIETERSTIISIRAAASEAETPVILLGESGARRGDVEDIAGYVRDGLETGRSRVIIKADRDVPHGFVQAVARAANSVEGIQFFIGVRDKRRMSDEE